MLEMQRCKATMVAMNWQEMMCPKTEHREFRKVAKMTRLQTFKMCINASALSHFFTNLREITLFLVIRC